MTLAVWIDGRILDDPAAPCLRADDRGFLLGDMAFETLRVSQGRACHWQRHITRLQVACGRLGFQGVQLPDESAAQALALRAQREDGALRLTVSRGAAGRGLAPTLAVPPTVVLTLSELPPALPPHGVPVYLAHPWVDVRSPLAGQKGGDRAGAVVQARAGAEGLVVDGDELLSGLSSNIFLVKDGAIATPPARGRVRAGVARELILERIAAALGIAAQERTLTRQDLADADELLFTNAVRGVYAAASFPEEHSLARPWGREVGARLALAYAEQSTGP